jgi:hypothetical protein
MYTNITNIRSTVVSSVMAASLTLLLGWPRAVNAVGQEEEAAVQQAEVAKEVQAPENVELANNEAKIDNLNVTATLITTEVGPARKVIMLECENTTTTKISGKLLVALTRTKGSGMERVMPTPQIAWRHIENVEVEPGGKIRRELTLPKSVGAEVLRVEKLHEKAAESETVRAPNVYYGAIAEAIESPAKPSSKSASAPSRRLSKLAMAPRDYLPKVPGVEFGY